MQTPTYNIQRERVLEADIEEVIEILDLDVEAMLCLFEEAGRDDLVYKAFRKLEGVGNTTDEGEDNE